MGKRNRQREKADKLIAPTSEYADADGNVLVLRGALSLATRARYAETLHGGLSQDDALARARELLFEHLAVAWTISGITTERQKELLKRYRVATAAERTFVRDALRAHLAEHFPEMEAP